MAALVAEGSGSSEALYFRGGAFGLAPACSGSTAVVAISKKEVEFDEKARGDLEGSI